MEVFLFVTFSRFRVPSFIFGTNNFITIMTLYDSGFEAYQISMSGLSESKNSDFKSPAGNFHH
jgi:hypothetical protein